MQLWLAEIVSWRQLAIHANALWEGSEKEGLTSVLLWSCTQLESPISPSLLSALLSTALIQGTLGMVDYQGSTVMDLEKQTSSRSLVCLVLVFFFRVLLAQLASDAPCRWGWVWIPDSPVPTSQLPASPACVDTHCQVSQSSWIWSWCSVTMKEKMVSFC